MAEKYSEPRIVAGETAAIHWGDDLKVTFSRCSFIGAPPKGFEDWPHWIMHTMLEKDIQGVEIRSIYNGASENG